MVNKLEIAMSVVAAVVCRFMLDRHLAGYLKLSSPAWQMTTFEG
jgi:hypothetical protein